MLVAGVSHNCLSPPNLTVSSVKKASTFHSPARCLGRCTRQLVVPSGRGEEEHPRWHRRSWLGSLHLHAKLVIVLCVFQAGTTWWGNDVWWWWRQNSRKKSGRWWFSQQGNLYLDRSWWLTSSYGRHGHGAQLPTFKQTTISKSLLDHLGNDTLKNRHAWCLLAVLVVPPMQSLSGDNDGT